MAAAYELSCAERPATVEARPGAARSAPRAVLAVDGAELTGHPRDRLPGLLSVVVRDTDGASVALALDLEGIATSVGSACATGSAEVSHVLTAMGYPDEEARGALRVSLGRHDDDGRGRRRGAGNPRRAADAAGGRLRPCRRLGWPAGGRGALDGVAQRR